MATTKSKNVKKITPKSTPKTTTQATPKNRCPSKVASRPKSNSPSCSVVIKPYDDPNSNTLAFVDLVFDAGFVVKGLTIVWSEQQELAFVGYPAKLSNRDGEYYCTCNPITKEYREELNNLVIEAYIEITGEDLPY